MTINMERNRAGVYRIATNHSPLNLRAEPNSASKIIAEIPKNGKVVHYGLYSGNWYHVQYLSRDTLLSGFASNQYLKKEMAL